MNPAAGLPGPVARALGVPARTSGPRLLALLPAVVARRSQWRGSSELPCRAEPELWHSEVPQGRDEARRACRSRCPHLAECAAQALLDDEEHGMWGGMSRAERRAATHLVRSAGLQCGHPEVEHRTRPDGSTWCARCARERRRRQRAAARAAARAAS